MAKSDAHLKYTRNIGIMAHNDFGTYFVLYGVDAQNR